ncbi:N-6 DNA methylase [Staphylococcus saprophyticus]|uniref:N-6 DNA methylase n=1 Tax=Staphylococcus saprophyticus TaxID=29385 RepID=UPI00381FCA5C
MDDVTKTINDLLGIKDSYQAPQRIMDILYSGIEDRNKVFMNFLEAFDKDVTYDWFHDYFQDEHADRKKHKQDFTPQSISKLLGEIVGSEGNTYYEPAAGTGGILIERWNQDRMKHSPFDYEPRDYYYTAEELSDRAIPFLLFNMLIRGMNGNVVQCDVLTREATGAFFIQNDANDFMGFSSLNLLPYNEDMETELNVKFVDQKYKPIKQTEKIPEWLLADIEIAELQS